MRIPLNYTIPGGLFVIALACIIGFAFGEFSRTVRLAENELRGHAGVVGNIVASAMETQMRRTGSHVAGVAFEQVRGDRRLLQALVVDQSDRIVQSDTLSLRGQNLSASKLQSAVSLLQQARRSSQSQIRIAEDGESVLSAFPIRLAASAGELTSHGNWALLMRHSLRGEKAAALATAWNRILLLGGGLILGCLLVWGFLNRTVVHPLRKLMQAAGQLSKGHPVAFGDAGSRSTEIAELTDAFGQMATALQARTQALEESQAFLQSAMDALPSHIAVLDDAGTIIAVNQAWVRFTEQRGRQLLNHGLGSNYLSAFLSLEAPSQASSAVIAAALHEVLVGSREQFRTDYFCPDELEGQWFTLEVRLFEHEGVRRVLLAHQDITPLKRAEQSLRMGEERFRSLYDHNPSMFFTVDADGRIESVNDFGADQLGYKVSALIGSSLFDLYPQEQRETVREQVQNCFANEGGIQRWEASKLRNGGALMWVRETARAVRGRNGAVQLLIVCEDVSETHDLSERLKYQANYDALTGLVNRREFDRRLQSAVSSAEADGVTHVLCYLDLDQFKVVNDTCGHIAGDELLRQLTQTVSELVRSRDTLARLGGDEFGILMQQCPLEHGVRRAEAIRTAVEGFRFAWEGNVFALGVSVGIAVVDAESVSATAVLSAADAACYAAKDAGRNRVSVFRSDDLAQAQRHGEMRWVSRVQQALDGNQFELFYQRIAPVARAGSGRGLHYELLLRLRGEDGRLIAPGAFLPAAERFHLASRIDRWVVASATRWLAEHPEHVAELDLCMINCSGQSLAEDSFLDFALQCIDDAGVSPSKLGFEITETAAIADLTRATRFIRELRGRGCRFALDDFGSGLSSFAYLKHLPVDFLKIDGAFVRDIANDPIDLAMVKSINEIGHVMGKQTIAEFVEDQPILDHLKAIGVDYAQGYAICKPRPIDELLLKCSANDAGGSSLKIVPLSKRPVKEGRLKVV